MLSGKSKGFFAPFLNLHFTPSFKSIVHILITYNSVHLIVAITLFYLIPYILNYPSGMIEGGFEKKWFGISYLSQFILIMSLVLIAGNSCLVLLIKKFITFSTSDQQPINLDSREKNIKQCLNLPYYIMVFQLIIPALIIMFVVLWVGWNKTSLLSVSKIVAMSTSSFFVFSSFLFVMLRDFSKKILKMTPSYNYLPTFRLNLQTKICLQFIPLIINAILFTSLLGYSQLISEKGVLLFQKYQTELDIALKDIQTINEFELKKSLGKVKFDNIKGGYFWITPKGEVTTYNSQALSHVFLECIRDLSARSNGKISDVTGETQGVVKPLKTNEGIWMVGFKYKVSSNKAVLAFLFSFIILLIMTIIFIYSLSKSLSDDIALISQQLSMIIEGQEVDLYQEIPITSNDEIGDLIVAFNKILDLEKENITVAKELAIIKERNRFSRDVHDTLGQTITNLVAFLNMIQLYLHSSPEKAEIYLEKATQTAKVGLSEVKKAISGLSELTTEIITIESLTKRIDLLIANYRIGGLFVEFYVSETNSNVSIEISDVIYRICQEAMTNAVNHGKAQHIKIVLTIGSDKLLLTISDNGTGCQHFRKGHGLSGMEERVKELNGSIIFNSCPNGFKIIADIPTDKT